MYTFFFFHLFDERFWFRFDAFYTENPRMSWALINGKIAARGIWTPPPSNKNIFQWYTPGHDNAKLSDASAKHHLPATVPVKCWSITFATWKKLASIIVLKRRVVLASPQAKELCKCDVRRRRVCVQIWYNEVTNHLPKAFLTTSLSFTMAVLL